MIRRRRQPLTDISARRIALIKPSALGDVVHAMPVLNALRIRFPSAEITWVVNKAYVALLQGHPSLDHIMTFDRGAVKKGVRSAIRESLRFAGELKRRRFDLVVDLQGLARSALMTLSTRAGRRIGLGTAREGARFAYTDVVPTPNALEQHAIDRYWLVAEAFGVGGSPRRFGLPVAADARQWAIDRLRELPRPWMAFGVGARWRTKRWLPEHFAELANRAQSAYGGTILFVGTPDEASVAEETAARIRGPFRNWCGGTSLHQLIGVLAEVDLMVSNDTGPLHVAVALGRPCAAPYTCTRTVRHGPYGQPGGVETNVWCKGSYVKTCDRMECMAELTPDRLWPALSAILSEWKSRSHSA